MSDAALYMKLFNALKIGDVILTTHNVRGWTPPTDKPVHFTANSMPCIVDACTFLLVIGKYGTFNKVSCDALQVNW